MEKVRELLEKMKEEVPGFVASAVVEFGEGLTVAEERAEPDFEVGITAAYSVEIMRAQQRSLQALGAEEEAEVLGITPSYYFFNAQLSENFCLHVVVSKEKGTLGLLLAYLKKYKRLLAEAIQEWQAA